MAESWPRAFGATTGATLTRVAPGARWVSWGSWSSLATEQPAGQVCQCVWETLMLWLLERGKESELRCRIEGPQGHQGRSFLHRWLGPGSRDWHLPRRNKPGTQPCHLQPWSCCNRLLNPMLSTLSKPKMGALWVTGPRTPQEGDTGWAGSAAPCKPFCQHTGSS